jgi:predicted nucleic acid-binding protein
LTSTPVTFDTNVLAKLSGKNYPRSSLLSAVVLQELTAGASDAAEIRAWDAFRKQYEAEGKLLVPNGEDWWMAGKILNSLYRGLRSRRVGHTSAIPKEEQQRLLRDVLIARTAKRANATVVTENLRDFEKIRRFCDVSVSTPAEYFGP